MLDRKSDIIGRIEGINFGAVHGWVINEHNSQEPVAVQLVVNEKVLSEVLTHIPRYELKGDPAEFTIPIPSHCFLIENCEIYVQFKDSGLPLEGSPYQLKPEHRFSYHIDGYVERNIISGWLKDYQDPRRVNQFTVELLEEGKFITSSPCDGLIDEEGAFGRFALVLPDRLLDESLHEFTFRCAELDWDFECCEFQTPSADPSRDYVPPPFLDDPQWEVSPAGKSARKKWLALATKKPEIDQTLETLEKKLAKVKLTEKQRRFDLLIEIAGLLASNNKPSESIERYKSAIDIDPSQSKAYTAVAEILIYNGQETEAITWLRKSLKKFPEHPEIMSRLDDLQARHRPVKPAKLIAFYLPQFHPTPENDQWWGKGFTEWANVAAASSLFHGHLQPRRPTDLGYYDLRLPEVANSQFELARRYGIDAFCYYYYWFDGKRILDRPLQDLADGKTGPFPFCICWANEDWTRSWDGQSGEVLLAQNHTKESDFRFIKEIAHLLKHPDYIRLEGKPVLLIYRPDKLASGKKTLKAWRDWCREQGIGELHLCAVQSFGFDDPRPLGFDAAVEFPPHSAWSKYPDKEYYKELFDLPGLTEEFAGKIYSYESFADASINRAHEQYQLHRTCMLAWDNTSRRQKTAHIYHHFSVAKFHEWLAKILSISLKQQNNPIVFINAWNEWAEGAILEPDVHFGYENLESVVSARRSALLQSANTYWKQGAPIFPEQRIEKKQRYLLVGHDAFRSGAQINLLNMARCLKRDLGMDLVIFLMQGGKLLGEFERVAPTFVLGKNWNQAWHDQATRYKSLGTRKALCNTVATGEVAMQLHKLGYRTVSLVHELPSLIKSHRLHDACWYVASHADNIVFASNVVAHEFCQRFWPDPERILIAPQGIVFNPYHAKRHSMRQQVMGELGLTANTRLIMGCGYGDTRKGIDIFVQNAGKVVRQIKDTAFLWVGDIEEQLRTYIEADIIQLGLKDHFHIIGSVEDTARYYISSDLFVLTSREDPFPSVVMEAFDAGLPVVAFDRGGGYVDIINDQTGELVPYLDVSAMACACIDLLKDNRRRHRIASHVHAWCRDTFGYPLYLRKLLALLDGVPARAVSEDILQRQSWYEDVPVPSISVIVPNYNYGRYLELRLRTILSQTLLPCEIIVLDDASSDYSLDVIQALAKDSSVPIRLMTNHRNSSNPFAQWAKGIKVATGDLVWIAEADDYCEPTLLETLAKELIDENTILAWCDSIVVDGLGRSEGFEYKTYFSREFGDYWQRRFKMDGRELIDRCLVSANVLPNASAVLFRRSAVDADFSLMEQYRFSGDWWFWLTLAEKGRVIYRPEALNYHRRHAQSVMGEVLRDGQHLILETIAFYYRIGEHKSSWLTKKTRLDIFERLETMYRRVPKLQTQSYWLREHSCFQADYQTLIELIDPVGALNAQPSSTSVLLVISDDALADTDSALYLIRELVADQELCLVVLGDPEKAERLIKVTELGEDQILHFPATRRSVLNSMKVLDMKLCEGRTPLKEMLEFVKILNTSERVISHGLLANCAVAEARDKGAFDWRIVVGKEFDHLLGDVPRQKGVTIDKLREALSMCSEVNVIFEEVPHALGRLAKEKGKPIFKWNFSARRIKEIHAISNSPLVQS